MEKKTTRRIIGVLVVFALVIIMLPLLVNNGQQSSFQTAEVKAPPFPDQQSISAPQPVSAGESFAQNSQIPASQLHNKIKKALSPTESLPGNTEMVADATPKSATPIIATAESNLATKPDTAASIKMVAATAKEVKAESFKTAKASASTLPAAKKLALNNSDKNASDNKSIVVREDGEFVSLNSAENKTENKFDVHNLKQTAWVIQMGSFRNTANAEHLTHSLKAKGFNAFLFKTESNGQTRVYVGPLNKQVAAAQLADKIEDDIKMRGVLVSYKPTV